MENTVPKEQYQCLQKDFEELKKRYEKLKERKPLNGAFAELCGEVGGAIDTIFSNPYLLSIFMSQQAKIAKMEEELKKST